MYTIDFYCRAGEPPVESRTIDAETIPQAIAEAKVFLAGHGGVPPLGGYVITDDLNEIVHSSFEEGD